MNKKYLEEYEKSFSPRLVMEEASRCLLCLDAPCSSSCPAGTDPAKFIRSLRFKNIAGAAETVRINNALGAICARVCPTEKYCQSGCSRSGIDKPINIGLIQRFITDYETLTKMEVIETKETSGKKVAIIGSGPSGLTAACELAKEGFKVTIYEKESKAGGYLRYGIPEYRLPNSVVDKEIERIVRLGVDIVLNTEIGVDVTLDYLKKDFDAVIVSVGYSKGKVLPLFEGNKKAITAVELLKKIKTRKGNIKLPESVLVIGGGDVSMDVLVSLKLLGVSQVTAVVYETFKEFKASKKELTTAQECGVSIYDGYVPYATQKGGIVKFSHRFIKSELKIKSDLIVLAVGQTLDKDLGLPFDKGEVNGKDYHLSGTNIFYTGDIASGDKTVVYAVKTGKDVAKSVIEYLK